jgi:hypothetical protein
LEDGLGWECEKEEEDGWVEMRLRMRARARAKIIMRCDRDDGDAASPACVERGESIASERPTDRLDQWAIGCSTY